jgi:hypothetical protein
MNIKFTARKFAGKLSATAIQRSSVFGKTVTTDVYKYVKAFLKSKFIYQVDITGIFFKYAIRIDQ